MTTTTTPLPKFSMAEVRKKSKKSIDREKFPNLAEYMDKMDQVQLLSDFLNHLTGNLDLRVCSYESETKTWVPDYDTLTLVCDYLEIDKDVLFTELNQFLQE